jgi:phosphoribosylaminoimidazole carboxylase PurE protein
MKRIIPIIMGSDKDYDFAKGIGNKLKEFSLPHEYRIASADKVPEFVSELVAYYDKEFDLVVYETVVGRANSLSGVVAGSTPNPVIACPLDTDKSAFMMDIFSSLRKPSDDPVMVVPGQENAALAAVKIFALYDHDLRVKMEDYIKTVKKRIREADEKIRAL